MKRVALIITLKKGNEELLITKAETLEDLIKECRWLMKVNSNFVRISFTAFKSNYIFERCIEKKNK